MIMNLNKVILFITLFGTYFINAVDAKYSKLIEKLRTRKTAVLEQVEAIHSWYGNVFYMLEDIKNNDVNNDESCKLADLKELACHIDADIHRTYLFMCDD